ncbi:universal stress protein [Reyranella soli]|uniref:Universal stress protein A n=1 Tax=Reyranella soli TaxID=1230389 RepID=A0A512NDS0_9HYPH|nr:universal stress protein [Reyranella soli]GEP57106.1 universal stress protein A [Reyranella soli]
MGYKTILVHCDADPKVAHRLAIAVELAKRNDARLVGVHIQEPFEAPPMFAGSAAMGTLFSLFEETAKANLAAAKAAFTKAVKGTDLLTEWRSEDGYIDARLPVHARYADLMVLGQPDPGAPSFVPLDLPETMALSTGRPILVVPHVGAPAECGKTVMLCWNASRESARAASDALPFLQAASKVIVLSVDPRSSNYGHGAEPGADAAAWLVRHGVKVTVQRDVASDSDVGSVILSRAADHEVDLVVMGLYGHSRLRELVLGGASRTLLANMTVPVLMSH